MNSLKLSKIENIFANRKAGHEDFFKEFAVLLPLIERDGKLYILYEVRARHMYRQPGEICFPGGEMEEDESPMTCALRETYEETGIPIEKIKIINQLDTVVTYSNFAMYCFLGVLDKDSMEYINLNPDEVEEVFLVELEELMATEPDVYWTDIIPKPPENFPYYEVTGGEPYKWRHGKAPVPVYKEMEGKVLWGLTARITKRFVDIIKGGEGHV